MQFKGLYIVTPNWEDTEQLLQVTEQILRTRITLLQYRNKEAGASLRDQQARKLLSLCKDYQCPLMINDHAQLCADIGADGVHIGAHDASVASVRQLIGQDKIIGVSCYGDLNRIADAEGANYIAFGGFYPSIVKKYPVTTALNIFQQAKAVSKLPTVAIGGINQNNAAPLIAAGADMIAVITAVYQAENPQHSAQQLIDLFKSSSGGN